FTTIIPAVLGISMVFGPENSQAATVFHRITIKTGYLIIRDIPSTKGKPAGVFYKGDDCIPALGSKKDVGRTWMKVFNPYLRSTGWVDSKFTSPSKSNCDFEKFLYGTRGKTNWVFDNMTFPLIISSPNADEEPPVSYSKEEVFSSTKNLNDNPYYYLKLLDDNEMKKFWAERDGCAKYELIENKKYDVNSYTLYFVNKTADTASIAFSCLEMYPEFKFRKTENGYILTGIEDSGS
ncbi:MAG TPA: hypothetical protein PLQ76_04165, partial [bacterium]|nr:hypothetical protein [bacterium]